MHFAVFCVLPVECGALAGAPGALAAFGDQERRRETSTAVAAADMLLQLQGRLELDAALRTAALVLNALGVEAVLAHEGLLLLLPARDDAAGRIQGPLTHAAQRTLVAVRNVEAGVHTQFHFRHECLSAHDTRQWQCGSSAM